MFNGLFNTWNHYSNVIYIFNFYFLFQFIKLISSNSDMIKDHIHSSLNL